MEAYKEYSPELLTSFFHVCEISKLILSARICVEDLVKTLCMFYKDEIDKPSSIRAVCDVYVPV